MRDDRAMDKLITPGVAERGLVSPQESVGVQELAVTCGCVHVAMLSWHERTCHDPTDRLTRRPSQVHVPEGRTARDATPSASYSLVSLHG